MRVLKMNWNKLLSEKRIKDLNGVQLGQSIVILSGNDTRSQFQRDYDRCLFSTPVRRLQDKAQVFPLEPNDSVRTRLTHSLEVSNIARGIAERIADKLFELNKINQKQKVDIIFIASACAVIHDLGNPPFGHSGEDAMRDWFKERIENNKIKIKKNEQKKDFLSFDGNAQTIRLVSKLQMLGDFSGLNLTSATLSASRKYLSSSLEIKKNSNQAFKKLGYFQSEKDLLKKVENETTAKGVRHPITYMVEAADDIVYSIIDLEDGLKKGVLTWDIIRNNLVELEPEIIKKAEKNIYDRAIAQNFKIVNQNEVDQQIKKIADGNKEKESEMRIKYTEFKQLSGHALAEARMNIFRTMLIGKNIDRVVDEFMNNYEEIMNGTFEGELIKNKDIVETIEKCKGLASDIVFRHQDILKLEIMGRNIIHDLMDHFWKGIERYPYDKQKIKNFPFEYKIYSLLSDNYKIVFEYNFEQRKKLNLDENYIKLQLLADYICGMTDNFAKKLHKEIKNG